MPIVKQFGAKAHKFVTRHPSKDKKYTLLEGSVRSSKTFALDVKIIAQLCSYQVEGKRIICGKTKGTVYRNMLLDLFSIVGTRNYSYNASSGELWLFGCQWFVMGAADEASYKNILGMTVGVAVLDEWTTFPRSFTMQLFLRLSPAGSRLYGSTNPGNPYDYLKTEVLDNAAFASDLEVIHFTLDDNPNIDPDEKRRIAASQTGVFYQRYILGLWVVAEGAIYRDALGPQCEYDDESRPISLYNAFAARYIGVDYGTTNPCVFLDVYDDGRTLWEDQEYYWDSAAEGRQKTDAEYADDLEKFAGSKRGLIVVVDPSAASFKLELVRRGFQVKDAVNDVIPGIRRVATMLKTGQYKAHVRNVHTRKETQTYAWDEKAAKRGEEKPVKEHDHGPDARRYVIHTMVPDWRLSQR